MPVIVVKRFHYIDDDEYDDDDDEEEEEEEEEEEDHGLEFDEDFEEDGFVSGDSNDSSVNENGDDSESCSYADSDWGSDNAPGFLNSDSD
ncbi:hypothetical protein EV182_005539 [Spiromyces aspiralis]|uniref:Uncharacterized protein n=1 Tax=Spiromyces aspiralis TaxID=68401 RepID=A0ACC1HDU2_9FUNG|nr:hypothetical protein EV182_005539 [Spiromyces aspiralis]